MEVGVKVLGYVVLYHCENVHVQLFFWWRFCIFALLFIFSWIQA